VDVVKSSFVLREWGAKDSKNTVEVNTYPHTTLGRKVGGSGGRRKKVIRVEKNFFQQSFGQELADRKLSGAIMIGGYLGGKEVGVGAYPKEYLAKGW